MHYSEKQVLKYSVKWYLISVHIFVIILALFFILYQSIDTIDIVGLLVICVMPFILMALFLFISALELNIKIDTNKIGYQIIPLFSEWKYISKDNIVSYQISGKVSMINNSKNKIKWVGKTKRFIISGGHYLELKLTGNQKLILSTLYPKKIEKAMQQLINQEK